MSKTDAKNNQLYVENDEEANASYNNLEWIKKIKILDKKLKKEKIKNQIKEEEKFTNEAKLKIVSFNIVK